MVKIIFRGNVLHNSDSNEMPKFIMGGREVDRAYIGSNELTQKETDSNLPAYARPEEMLLWYDFKGLNNSAEGRSVIKDLSGNGNDGVLHNFNFTEESGYVENGLKFDGVDDYLTFNDVAFNPEDDFTMEIRMEEIVGEPGIRMNQQTSLFYRLVVYSSFFQMWNSNSDNVYVTPRHSQENHFVLRREDTMTTALNNGEYSTISSERMPKEWNNARIFNSFGFSGYIFEGVISSIRIYKSALNSAEIKHNHYIDNGMDSILTEETVNAVVPFRIEHIFDDTEEVGYEEVTKEGLNGEADITYSVIHIDGEEIDRAEKTREFISEVINEVKIIGDKGRVVYGEGSTSISFFAFDEAGLTGDIRIADSVTVIDGYAFRNNQITSVYIPDSVLTIGNQAFRNNQMTSVYIPDSVISIAASAFDNNPLIEVSIASHTEYSGNSFPDSAVITVRD